MFKEFDFNVLNSKEFKEDAVREELINPILKKLGYKAFGENKIIYSKKLQHPFIKTGTGKNSTREIINFPDYLLEVNKKYCWVLDAKSPVENILTGVHKEQAYFYAIHPDIRVRYYALCNGQFFTVYDVSRSSAIINVSLVEIEKYWTKIEELLSPKSFLQTNSTNNQTSNLSKQFDYSSCSLLPELPVKKQQAKRHFGVHGYFTRQSWNVVQEYIKNYTKPGDIVLDPFGGSGVTIIEALMSGRKGIHIDINPMSSFMVDGLLTPVNINELFDTFDKIKKKFNKSFSWDTEQIEICLQKYSFPKDIQLIKGSDCNSVDQLFTRKQLSQLAFLKYLIYRVRNKSIRTSLLLVFSSSITKFNKTYHPSKSRGINAGNAGPFCYYRYRIAKEVIELDLMDIFETKLKKLCAGKKEISSVISTELLMASEILKGSATNLPLENESIDYIYTDPPYGSKIPYLDLSVMWNSWLDFNVSEEDYSLEAIEGGKNKKTIDEYSNLIEQSLKEMYRVLKFDRWLSFVFAHKDPKYWHLIVYTAEKLGFEYAGVVKQSNGQKSYKKRQNPFSVLSGQLIINFRKAKTPEVIQKIALGADIFTIIIETIESVIAKDDGAALEEINDELIIKGLELGFLDVLSREYNDLTAILEQHFDFDSQTEKFHIRKNKTFKTHIDIHLRIRYFLISYLKRKKLEKAHPTTDQIILDIMPLLKNGTTPENQTILNVLEQIAYRITEDRWELNTSQQLNLF
jgi:16S rRNA G966 N2-methylase RsmD